MSDRSCSAGRHQNGKYDGCRWRRGHVLRRHASDARGSRLPSGGSGRQVIGRNCRWLDGAVRQQCVGHLPFERQARANGGFSVRRTGSIDPERSLRLPQSCRSGTQGFHEFRCSEAAVRDLTHPATNRPWQPNPDSGHPGDAVCSLPTCQLALSE